MWLHRCSIPTKGFGSASDLGVRLCHSSLVVAKTIPFITCEIALCQYFCELVFAVNIFDLGFGVQVDSVTQPIKRNSLGSGHVSQSRTSTFDDHLDHCFIIFKIFKVSHQIEKISRLKKHIRYTELESELWCVFLMVCHAASFPALSLWNS